MMAVWRAIAGGAAAEFIQLRRSPLLVALTVVQAVTFLFLVSLFGMTGARAPTALVDYDLGGRAQAFIQDLKQAHHSFTIKPMSENQARDALEHGNLVSMIVIPRKFTYLISSRRNVSLEVVVDNIDTDMTADIQRALPSAIVAFGKRLNLPGIRVRVEETDLIDHDTEFIPYLVASALVLSAFIIAGNLSAVAVAREYESGTSTLLCLSPVHPLAPIFGRLLAVSLFSLATLVLSVCVAIFGYGIVPAHPLEMAFALAACVFIFGCLGAALGAALKYTLPVSSIIFGLALPLFLVSGSYEPERFDGNLIWGIAHFSPVYYAVGIIEHAVHNLKVTPETVGQNFLALGMFGLFFLCLAAWSVKKGISV